MSVLPGQAVAHLLEEQDAAQDGGLTVFEAKNGRFRHFAYPPAARITGLDISAEQLAANDYADEKIEGDVQTWTTDRHWDVVISVFVLEHVEFERPLSVTRLGGGPAEISSAPEGTRITCGALPDAPAHSFCITPK